MDSYTVSARSPRALTAHRHEPASHRASIASISSLAPRFAPPFAYARRIDPVTRLCHSQPHQNRSADTDPSAPCIALSASTPRPAALRRGSSRFQIPNAVALNPAVQSNKFYPPC